MKQTNKQTKKIDNENGSRVSPYGVLIAIRRDKLSIKQLQVSDLPSEMCRKLLSAHLNTLDVWVNTIHLESLENQQLRIQQLQLIFETYFKAVIFIFIIILLLERDSKQTNKQTNKQKKQGESSCLLMGDFNYGDKDAENKYIPKDFIDCWLEFARTNHLDVLTGSTCSGDRYDKILAKMQSGKDTWKVSAFEKLGRYFLPSDHLELALVHLNFHLVKKKKSLYAYNHINRTKKLLFHIPKPKENKGKEQKKKKENKLDQGKTKLEMTNTKKKKEKQQKRDDKNNNQ
ncbi:hypothetical protein RFI_27063 [Reticulomyxa filosa]|uniref:Endonuclease/exonuclease/phosphatase domain-containing protein n=1 Tax=Reticulomyxa filosa TaxID=46433 RepID=X6M8S7_RETFI|nr:hypothetical protein RFI_27063 [Reticulomyxa filosa]|eukprot:ETO10314.1 hypothetical protein RFI_27063 [Reticulomyxa filosa]